MIEPDTSLEERRAELAVLHALGALDGESFNQVGHCLGCPASDLARSVEAFDVLVAAMSQALLPQIAPPPEAKTEIDQLLGFTDDDARSGASSTTEPGAEGDGFAYVMNDEGEWRPLPVLKGGARVKELSNDASSGVTVLLLELDPGTRFPSHSHHGVEETFLISGDLHMADRVLGPGDYARALPGSRHSSLYSEHGCRALIMTAPENYPRRSVKAYGALHTALSRCKKLFTNEPKQN